jgi:hypothetical protein
MPSIWSVSDSRPRRNMTSTACPTRAARLGETQQPGDTALSAASAPTLYSWNSQCCRHTERLAALRTLRPKPASTRAQSEPRRTGCVLCARRPPVLGLEHGVNALNLVLPLGGLPQHVRGHELLGLRAKRRAAGPRAVRGGAVARRVCGSGR